MGLAYFFAISSRIASLFGTRARVKCWQGEKSQVSCRPKKSTQNAFFLTKSAPGRREIGRGSALSRFLPNITPFQSRFIRDKRQFIPQHTNPDMSAIINALKKALDLDPSDWENRHALVEAYMREDHKNEARLLLNEVQTLPEDEPSQIAAAKCYGLVGGFEHAHGILQPILDANPANAEAHLALASSAHQVGDAQTAMRHFITATSLNPGLSDPDLQAAYGGVLGGTAPAPTPVPEPAPAPTPQPGPVAEIPPQTEPVAEIPAQTEPVAEIPVQTEPVAEIPAQTEPVAEIPVQTEPVAEIPVQTEPVAEIPPQTEEIAAEMPAVPEVEPAQEVPAAAEEELAAPPVPNLPEAEAEAAQEPGKPVFYAAPGQFPTQTLSTAVATRQVKPIVDPANLPQPPVLRRAKPARDVPTLADEADPHNVVVEPKTDERVVYDYQNPDDSIFDPAIGPDQINVAAAETEDGQRVATPDDSLRHQQEVNDAVRQRALRRDKLNSLVVTILIHVGIVVALGLAVVTVPIDVAPQIVAKAAPAPEEDQMRPEEIVKPTVRPPSTNANATPNVIMAASTSAISMSNVDFDGPATAAMFGTDFTPAMSFGPTSSSDSKMMFGQKIEGKVLGVVLDVSGSMAEHLPLVIREVDRNFKNAPIVYVNHALIRGSTESTNIYPIKKEEVLPSWPRAWAKGSSPYWFLWGDLPRKAPQRSVDRLIRTFKERPNSFIARGGYNRIGAAIEFLIEQKVDSLYVFSDFEDFVEEERCETFGQLLGRSKVRAYVQPAENQTDHLSIVTKKIANRSKGRQLPPLVDLFKLDEEPKPLVVVQSEEDMKPKVSEKVAYATTRDVRQGEQLYSYRPNLRTNIYKEIKTIEEPTFDIVLCGPEARAYIFLKSDKGIIQSPIVFGYHSRKPYLGSDNRWHTRKRKFLRNREEPTLEGNEFRWTMVLEDEIEFDVWFTFRDKTMTGTYKAEFPPNDESDGAYIFFTMPRLAWESKDSYYSTDFPEGLTLDELRVAMQDNFADFYLPSQAEERYGKAWAQLGFKRGHNLLVYNKMFRTLPDAVREFEIYGPSFGPRKIKARTTSNRLLLHTGTRADMELWEGFASYLVRPRDRRERAVKTEAIAITIE